MQQLNRTTGVTFVIATHDPEVAACTDRMVRIRDGQVASDQRRRVDLRRLRELR
jgi:putative ABC transport system ATP-binding protein